MLSDDTRKKLKNIINGIILDGEEDNCTTARNLLCASFRTSTTVKKDFESQSVVKKEQPGIINRHSKEYGRLRFFPPFVLSYSALSPSSPLFSFYCLIFGLIVMFELILKNITRHIQLTEEEEAYFVSLLKTRLLRKKQYLVQSGDVSKYECFVNKGCMRAYSVDSKGQEHIVQFAIEDWWIGDMYSFVSGEPAIYNVDALEDAELVLIDRNNMEQLYKRVPAFERFFRIIIQHAFINMQRRIVENMSIPAEERYLHFKERYPKLEQRIPQHQVASFLGITAESLSRIRSKKR